MGTDGTIPNSPAWGVPRRHRGLVYVAIAALLWSSSGLFIKLMALNALQIAFYRSLIAALTIFVVCWVRKERLDLRLDLPTVGCALSYAAVLILFVTATKLTRAANAIFLQFTAPIYLLFLEPLFLHAPFRRRNLAAVGACVVGMALFFGGKLEKGDLLGNLLAMASGLSLAVFSLLLKAKSLRRPDRSPVGAIVLGNLAIGLVCLPFVFRGPALDLRQGSMLLYLGVFQLGLAYMFYAAGLRYTSATGASITSMLEGVFNPVWVFLGIGERPSSYALLGALIILGAILAHNLLAAGIAAEPSQG